MSKVYFAEKVWLTIDVEELNDTNFGLNYLKSPNLDYEKLINNWLELCERNSIKSTAFVLGSFAKKYPDLVKKLHANGHEIACHGEDHRLVYDYSQKEWEENTKKAKQFLEDLISDEVEGYRSPSWSLPFENSYYEDLVKMGFRYSSSYFPFKTYMYGNSEDKKKPFVVHTEAGEITEIPLAKYGIPFSGGFYLRALPFFLQKILMKKLSKITKPIIYIHPYELSDENPYTVYRDLAALDKEFFLAFFSLGLPNKKIESFIKCAA